MRYPKEKIRAIALGLICEGDRVFVAEGYDYVEERQFYRALGGGIDFGETSQDALKREFQEELGASLTNITLLTCLENIFVYNGKPGHEIIFLYQCDFADPGFYRQDEVTFMEGDDKHLARWVRGDRFKSGELHLVPDACLQYLP
jgi:8-oxo-dGTP pyrophosphatase MutT (NUDIX family)